MASNLAYLQPQYVASLLYGSATPTCFVHACCADATLKVGSLEDLRNAGKGGQDPDGALQ